MIDDIVLFKEPRATIFRLPNVISTQGYYLDHWRDKIWEGQIEVKTSDSFLKLVFTDVSKKLLYLEAKLPLEF